MQTPYQHLAAPHAVALPVAAAAPSSSNECCPCCVEPACCSRVGACPCFCSGYTAAFSVALSSIWLALPMLITALSTVDLFEVQVYGYSSSWFVGLGMWQSCDTWDGCSSYSGLWEADSSTRMFQAMRSMAVIATFFTLTAGILGAIRLGRMQRSKANSPALNNATLVSALLAMGSSAASFGLTFPLHDRLSSDIGDQSYAWADGTSFGVSWVMLTVGMALLVVGTAVHLVAHCLYQRSTATADDSEQPGLYAVHGYSTSTSVFSHPQPLHQHALPTPVVYYPTATAVHYPTAGYAQQPVRYQ